MENQLSSVNERVSRKATFYTWENNGTISYRDALCLQM